MRIPKLCRQKLRDLAFVTEGKKRIYFGKWGSPEAEAKYLAYVNEITQPGGKKIRESQRTVSDLSAAFLEARKDYYVKNGKQTGQLERHKTALDFCVELYPSVETDDFGPRKLLAVRHAMETSGRFSRKYVNTLINCVRCAFRWGVENELVKPETLWALQAVAPLKRRRSIARESLPVSLVDPAVVEKTLEFLPPTIADMVRVQRLTGMRPGEVCAMKAGDLQINERGVMVYSLSTDKTDWRREADQIRRIFLGPKVEAILAPYLLKEDDPDAYIFTPKNAVFERALAKKKKIVKASPKRLNPYFDTAAYRRAITRATVQAGVPKWSPNQLRHLYATEIRQKYGLEAAQIMLGHANANVTQIYAERDERKMEDIASREG